MNVKYPGGQNLTKDISLYSLLFTLSISPEMALLLFRPACLCLLNISPISCLRNFLPFGQVRGWSCPGHPDIAVFSLFLQRPVTLAQLKSPVMPKHKTFFLRQGLTVLPCLACTSHFVDQTVLLNLQTTACLCLPEIKVRATPRSQQSSFITVLSSLAPQTGSPQWCLGSPVSYLFLWSLVGCCLVWKCKLWKWCSVYSRHLMNSWLFSLHLVLQTPGFLSVQVSPEWLVDSVLKTKRTFRHVRKLEKQESY